jgi:lysyl-tRNA synthetase, class II
VPLAELTLEIEGGNFLDTQGQRAGLLLFAGMLVSFGFIRMSTRLMRSPKVTWWPGSVTPGGLHIHHLVFGIVLMMLAGFLQFTLLPDSPWVEILAVAFGIGVGLTLDEFALWLYLEDVYWAEEGRRSVDAFIFAAIIGGLFLMGFVPVSGGTVGAVVVSVAIELGLCLIVASKGKIWSAVTGMFLPLIALIAAIRLARPGSPWARRRYKPGSKKLAKAEDRARRHDRRWQWLQNLIGGAPSTPSPRAKE